MPASLDEIKKGAETRMGKSLDSLKKDLDKIRTGRAHTGLLDHIQVEYYGTMTPLNQIANITVEDARTLLVTPWEKNMVTVIDKTIRESDLGLNPAAAGQAIRVPMPLLTEERRKELAKLVRSEGESTKVAIRNIRRDSNNHIKELLKKKENSEDNSKRAEDTIQKFTDSYTDVVDKIIIAKEVEIMEV